MAGEIIRMGDKTSHGGTVLEGSLHDICMGKPIAYVGHKTHCPKCKGTFPIIEGVLTTTFYGKGVAVAGMRTACGAVLIAPRNLPTRSSGALERGQVSRYAQQQRSERKQKCWQLRSRRTGQLMEFMKSRHPTVCLMSTAIP